MTSRESRDQPMAWAKRPESATPSRRPGPPCQAWPTLADPSHGPAARANARRVGPAPNQGRIGRSWYPGTSCRVSRLEAFPSHASDPARRLDPPRIGPGSRSVTRISESGPSLTRRALRLSSSGPWCSSDPQANVRGAEVHPPLAMGTMDRASAEPSRCHGAVHSSARGSCPPSTVTPQHGARGAGAAGRACRWPRASGEGSGGNPSRMDTEPCAQ